MATKTLSIAGVSDFDYDDALFPAAIHTTGILRSDATPVGGSDVLRKDDVGIGGTIAPADAQYIVVALDGILTDERVLAVNTTNLSLTDGGANGNITLNTIQNIDASAIPEFAGLGIGTDSPDKNLDVTGDDGVIIQGDFAKLFFNDTGAGGVGAYIAENAAMLFFGKTNTPSIANDIMMLDLTNQHVGIGDVPSYRLHVRDERATPAFFDYRATAADNDNPVAIGRWTTGDVTNNQQSQLEIFGVRSVTGGLRQIQLQAWSNNFGTARDLILNPSGGNVGIGTDIPNYPLAIVKDQNGVTLALIHNPNVGTLNQAKFSAASDSLSLSMGVTAASTDYFGNTPGGFIIVSPGQDLFFVDGSTINVMIKGNGNVGINEINPDEKFEVNGNVHITGDSYWTGDGSGVPYGSMYNDNADTTVTIVSTGVAVRIPSGFTQGQVNLATFSNSRELTVTKAGRYRIDWNISFTMAAGANHDIEGRIGINNAANAQGAAHRFIGTRTDTGNMAGVAILDLVAGTVVSLMMENDTNTENIVVNHANLTLVMVGGT